MQFTTTLVLAALSATAWGAAAPDVNDPGAKLSRAEADLFPRAIYCPCTSTRTCGCGSGSWCQCLEPKNSGSNSKAYCSKNKVCGCPGGSYGYCVVRVLLRLLVCSVSDNVLTLMCDD